MNIYRSVTEMIGNTPLLHLQRYGEAFCPHASVLAKLEYCNPAGSAKDRVAAEMIARAEADGKLKPCLHSGDEYSLKGLDFDGMKAMLEEVIWNKPAWHGELDAIHRSQAGRNMNQIGG